MAASLTEQEFSQHVGTKFQLSLDQQAIELELVEVKGYLAGSNEQGGMERFWTLKYLRQQGITGVVLQPIART